MLFMKQLIFWCIVLVSVTLTGQDSTWQAKDKALYLAADSLPTCDKAVAYIAPKIARRRATGPITPQLVENYRKTAFWLSTSNYGNIPKPYAALLYLDTVFALQQQINTVPLKNQALAEYLMGDILNSLEITGPSQYWHDRALATLQKAIARGDSLSAGGNPIRIQRFLSIAGDLAARNQDFRRSELLTSSSSQYFERYRSLMNPETASYRLLVNLMVQGLNLQKQERFVAARKIYDRALNSPLLAEDEIKYAGNRLILRGNYANSFVEEGNYATGESLVRELLEELLPKSVNNAELRDRSVVTYGYLLNALQGQGKYAEMPAIYDEAVALRYQIDATDKGRNIGLINTFMAEAASKQGDFAAANAFFDKARFNFVGDATPLGPARLPRIQGNLIYGQEEMLYYLQAYREAWVRAADAGDDQALDHALATARTIDSLLQRGIDQLSLTASIGGFLKLENRHYERAIGLALRLHREREDQTYLAEAFRFASVQKANLLRRYLGVQELAQSYDVPQAVIGEKVRLETDVLILEKALAEASAAKRPALRQQLLSKQQELSEIRRTLEEDYQDFSRAMRGASLADPIAAAASLAPDRMVIEYFLGQDSIYQFALSADNGLTYAVTPKPDNLPALTSQAITDTAQAARLYQLLVAPSLPASTTISRLQFIPDGELWNVNFQSLSHNGRLLIQHQAVSYAYSSGLLFDDNRETNQSSTYLGLGISYDDMLRRIQQSENRSGIDSRLRNMGSLAYARQEVEEVAAILNATLVPEQQATKAYFFDQAPSAGIIHLAMHGILEDNPMESALVFQSSEDSHYDLLRMRELLGKRFPAQLTILSACHSGYGPLEVAEGHQSIGRAFMAAGSKAVITSKWAAPDKATAVIIQKMTEAISAGLPSDLALQQGIAHYLEESSVAERDPRNWAHLNLTGSVQPLYPESSWKWLWAIPALLVFAGLFRRFRRSSAQA